MSAVLKAVAYARFSSDGQREESIEAQVRAITEFAKKNKYNIQKVYTDRAISGTTDKRPEFLRMIDDAKNGRFDTIIVHKLDRFARNRADSAIYRKKLSDYKVKLVSVLEQFDDSPESIILQSVIEGYNEYYSQNLRREVMKGLMENARTCRHTGGTPCLGYNVDRETMRYKINPHEAEAVKLIFKLYLEGYGYGYIIDELNKKGYTTKRGVAFGKNSLYEILRNEKYSGVYVYNKSVHPDENGKFNRRKSKDDSEIIRIEGGVPQIISKEDFECVQKRMAERRGKTAMFKAKQEYLLSGKMVCGECGSTYAGNSRKPREHKPLYISYVCIRRNGKSRCKNPGIVRDVIEKLVLNRLSKIFSDEEVLIEIMNGYNIFFERKNKEINLRINELNEEIAKIKVQIDNIVNLLVDNCSYALTDKLNELENKKGELEQSLYEAEVNIAKAKVSKSQLRKEFKKAKAKLETGEFRSRKVVIEQYVKQVVMYKDKIIIKFNIVDDYILEDEVARPEKGDEEDYLNL